MTYLILKRIKFFFVLKTRDEHRVMTRAASPPSESFFLQLTRVHKFKHETTSSYHISSVFQRLNHENENKIYLTDFTSSTQNRIQVFRIFIVSWNSQVLSLLRKLIKMCSRDWTSNGPSRSNHYIICLFNVKLYRYEEPMLGALLVQCRWAMR